MASTAVSAIGFGCMSLSNVYGASDDRRGVELIREAIEFHIDGLKQDGLPVPPPSSAGEFVEVGAA